MRRRAFGLKASRRFFCALVSAGKATSTVSLNMKIRRVLRPFLLWANCDRDRNRTSQPARIHRVIDAGVCRTFEE